MQAMSGAYNIFRKSFRPPFVGLREPCPGIQAMSCPKNCCFLCKSGYWEPVCPHCDIVLRCVSMLINRRSRMDQYLDVSPQSPTASTDTQLVLGDALYRQPSSARSTNHLPGGGGSYTPISGSTSASVMGRYAAGGGDDAVSFGRAPSSVSGPGSLRRWDTGRMKEVLQSQKEAVSSWCVRSCS